MRDQAFIAVSSGSGAIGVTPRRRPGRMNRLGDGTVVGYRPLTSSGSPSIEIDTPASPPSGNSILEAASMPTMKEKVASFGEHATVDDVAFPSALNTLRDLTETLTAAPRADHVERRSMR